MIEIHYYKNFLHPIGFQFFFFFFGNGRQSFTIQIRLAFELTETGSAAQGFRSLVFITTPCSKSNFYKLSKQITNTVFETFFTIAFTSVLNPRISTYEPQPFLSEDYLRPLQKKNFYVSIHNKSKITVAKQQLK